jgi:hypothetical protein
MDEPVLIPNLFMNLIKEGSFLEFISKFSAEDDRESFDRDEEVFRGREPFFTILGDAAARDDIVNMRVKGEVACPSMEYPHHTDESTDKSGIFCESEQSF